MVATCKFFLGGMGRRGCSTCLGLVSYIPFQSKEQEVSGILTIWALQIGKEEKNKRHPMNLRVSVGSLHPAAEQWTGFAGTAISE